MSKAQKRKKLKNKVSLKPSAEAILLDAYLGEMSCIGPLGQWNPSIKPVGNSS